MPVFPADTGTAILLGSIPIFKDYFKSNEAFYLQNNGHIYISYMHSTQ